MGYLEQCLHEHIRRMEFREQQLQILINEKQAVLDALRGERKELEIGFKNWREESAEDGA